MNERFARFVIDRLLSMQKILRKAGHSVSVQGTCFCPFHDDKNHRSAKLYQDEDGSEHLFCFSERRSYRSSDVITSLLGQSINPWFEALWGRLNSDQRAALMSDFRTPVDYVSSDWKQLKRTLLPLWAHRKIAKDQLLQELALFFDNQAKP